jgi:hypothetical protein
MSGARGEPAPDSTKVCINFEGGFRNRMTFCLTGPNQQAKADWLTDQLFTRLGGRDRFAECDVRFVEAPSDARTQEQATGRLHVTVKDPDERKVGRAFSSAASELALSSIPGFFTTTPPGEAQPYGVYWPALVPSSEIDHRVVLHDGTQLRIPPSPTAPAPTPAISAPVAPKVPGRPLAAGHTLGERFGARSGDKGGNANVGIWARQDDDYVWLA